MSDHWSTRHLTDEEVRLYYERIMSRLAGDSFEEVVDELRLRLGEAHEQGWIDEYRREAGWLEEDRSEP